MRLLCEMTDRQKNRFLDRISDSLERRLPDDAMFLMAIGSVDEPEFRPMCLSNGDKLQVIDMLRDLAGRMEQEIISSN